MERLTNQDHKKAGFCAYVGEKNPYETPLTVGEIAAFSTERDGFSPQQILREILDRLAAYEDTDMTPERVSELAQAERDGRLVVLPEGKGDMTLVSAVSMLSAERNAAIQDLEKIMYLGSENLDTCIYCARESCYARGGYRLCDPVWRGRGDEAEAAEKMKGDPGNELE